MHGGRLPEATSRFLGRSHEAAAIRDALARSRLVTLTGPGGVGKTRLAVRVAGDAVRTFPDGVFLADLSAARDAAGVARTVAAALGARGQAGTRGQSQAGWLASRLRGQRVLLILDTCEHVVDACAALADTIVHGAAEPVLLVTGRQPLDLPGEVVFRISPLDAADSGGAAVSLLADRAAAAPGFAVTPGTLPRLVDLCRRLDGMPLAIELAALRLRTAALDDLLGWLPGHLRQLGVGRPAAAAGRHQSLHASVVWSYDLCTPAERLLWTRLSVFPGSFDLAAAEAVCSSGALGAAQVVDTLIALVDKSVVLRERDEADTARYRLPGVEREHGAELATDAQVCAARHRGHYLDVAAAFADSFNGPEFNGSGQPGLVAALARDEANLRLAFDDALAGGAVEMAAELAVACWPWLICTDRFGLARSWLSAVSADPSVDGYGGVPAGGGGPQSPHRELARRLAFWVTFVQGDAAAAGALSAGNAGVEAEAGADPAAGAASEPRGVRAGELAPPASAGRMMPLLDGLAAAMDALRRDEYADCAARCDALTAALPAGERWVRGWAAWFCGIAAWLDGDRDIAGDRLRSGLDLLMPFGGELAVAQHLEAFAWLAEAAGDHRRTARLLGAADRIWQRLAEQEGVRVPRFGLAVLDAERDVAARQAMDALGTTRYTTEHAAGMALTIQAAVRNAVPSAPSQARQGPGRPAADRRPGGSVSGSASGSGGGGTGGGVGGSSGTQPRSVPGGAGGSGGARTLAGGVPGQSGAAESAARWAMLTAREREVAALVASGLANKDIASRLVVSKRTVDAHIEHILGKLGYSSRVQIAALAAGQHDQGPRDPGPRGPATGSAVPPPREPT